MMRSAAELGTSIAGVIAVVLVAVLGLWAATTTSDQLIRFILGLLVVVLFGLWILSLRYRSRFQEGRAKALKAEHDLNTLVEKLPVAAYMGPLDDSASTSYISPEIEHMLGYSRQEWIADSEFWPKILHSGDRERVMAEHVRHMKSGERFDSQYRMVARDGSIVWVRDEAVIVRDPATGQAFQHGVMVNMTDRKRAEEALEHQALHDALTGLPNRTLLNDRLHQAILAGRREQQPVALLLMDLDRFKEVNDTFGHHYGDLLLVQVGERVRQTLRASDTVSRLGGDEFAVLLPTADLGPATQIAHKIASQLRQPFDVDGQTIDVGVSIGIALYPENGEDAHTLLQRADVAMYAAKSMDDDYATYSSERDPYSVSRLALISDLRQAIDNERLFLHYQPKVHFNRGGFDHVEALVRWTHPQRGEIPPAEFVPLAEHAGLIKPLTAWVLNEALRQCHEWDSAGMHVTIAVNLSARSLHDPELVPLVQRLLKQWDVAPDRFEVEITEGALMVDPVRALETVTRFRDMGIFISIDDFGTGYSSLGYLKRLPAHRIKIDSSFVTDMARNEDDAFIVRYVIDLGHSLGLEVIAEGIESTDAFDLLATMGCDAAQGFLLSRPLPPDELSAWLATQRASIAVGE